MSTPTLGYPSSLMMARSPIFITGKNNTLANDSLDSMTLSLLIGSPSLPTTTDYSLSKDYSVDDVINFEISDLIRDQFTHDFTIYDASGYVNSPTGEILWVTPRGDWTYSDNGTAPSTAVWSNTNTYSFLAADGWNSSLASTAITSASLSVSRDRYVLASQYGLLALNNLQAIDYIKISWNNGDEDFFYYATSTSTIPAAGTSTTTSVIYAAVYPQNLQNNPYLDNSIKPSTHDTGDYYDVEVYNSSSTLLFSQRFILTCEPRYTPYQVSFINRYGVLDYLTFFKRSDERGAFVQDSYEKSIYNDAFTSPTASIGKYTSFNVNSRNSYTLNTGFVGEDHNDVIEDILMSENVTILINGTWYAVVPERGTIEYQKHVNQKLINYTMTFNLAFDQRSLIR
jgi:hypothetical protein